MLPDLFNTTVGILAGIVFIVPTIIMIRKRGFDHWEWPFFLASLPVCRKYSGPCRNLATVLEDWLLTSLPTYHSPHKRQVDASWRG